MADKGARNAITLKGSAQIVGEYFGYALNSILYQRGIYDPDSFTTVKKYGLRLFVSTDDALTKYFKATLRQLTEWLIKGEVRKLVLVLSTIDTKDTIERWVFNVDTNVDALDNPQLTSDKPISEIQKEISHVMRQITSSVSFLPLIDVPCSFDLLMYTNNDSSIPNDWELSDPKFVIKSNQVRLKSFSTDIHTVDTSVTYRVD